MRRPLGLLIGVRVRVHDPGAVVVCEDRPIQGRTGGCEDPDDRVRELRVEVVSLAPTVGTDDPLPHSEGVQGRDLRADGRLEGLCEDPPLCQQRVAARRLPACEELGRRADDRRAQVVVAHVHRHRRRDRRVLLQTLPQRGVYVAHRRVQVVKAIEHELQGAALGTHDQVIRPGLADQCVLGLVGEQQNGDR